MNHKFLLGMSKQSVERLLVKASLFALTLAVVVNAVAGPSGKTNRAYDNSMTSVTDWISEQFHSYENETWEQRLRRLMRSNLEEVGGTKKAVVDTQVRCLAENIYFESRGESLAGQVAVAKVTLNRLDEGYARTVCGVVKQGCQFSWVCNHPGTQPSGQHWTQAVGIALVMLSDKDHIEDPTNGATHFHATYINWQPNWKRVKDSVNQIGNHVFYRIKPKEEK
jgi:spore germination cell wall hydrolase CwlJ-like protein